MLYLIHKYLTQAAAGTQARLQSGVVGESTATGRAGGSDIHSPEVACGGAGAAAAAARATLLLREPAKAPAVATSAATTDADIDSDVRDVQANLGRIRCALPLPTGEHAVAHPDWSEGQPPLHPHAAAAFQSALLSNANLCGDNCNRGMLAGAVLGFLFGAHNIPAPLVSGLHRYDGELRHTIKAFVAQIVRPQVDAMAAAHGPSVVPSRFGRPAMLPVLRFPLYAKPSSHGGAGAAGEAAGLRSAAAAGTDILVHAPRDLSHKLRMVQLCAQRAQAAAAAASSKPSSSGRHSDSADGSFTLAQLSSARKPVLRFHKGAGPLLVEPAAPFSTLLGSAAAAAGRVARPLLLPAAATRTAAVAVPGPIPSSSTGDLDDGDAAADRAAALAAMQAGNASGVLSSGAASGTSGVMPPPLPTPLARARGPAPAAAASGSEGQAVVAQVAVSAASSGVVRVAEMHASALDSELPCNALLDASTLAPSGIAAAAVAAVQDVTGVAAEPGTGTLYYRPRDAAAAAALLGASGAEAEPWAAIVARHRSGGSAAGAGVGLTEAATDTCK